MDNGKYGDDVRVLIFIGILRCLNSDVKVVKYITPLLCSKLCERLMRTSPVKKNYVSNDRIYSKEQYFIYIDRMVLLPI